jgi:hypothetical protein
MKQPFGIDFSAEDLPTVFATCVSCFDHALDKASSSKDLLRLSLIRLHLTRWGKAINLYGKTGHENVGIYNDDVEEIKKILTGMMASFEALSTLGTITQGPPTDVPSNHTNINTDRSTQTLLFVLKVIASERFGGESLLNPESLDFGRWHSSLIEEVPKLVKKLTEEDFPVSVEQRELCAEERIRFKEAGALDFLASFPVEMDDDLMHSGLMALQFDDPGDACMINAVGGNVVGWASLRQARWEYLNKQYGATPADGIEWGALPRRQEH